MSNVINLFNPAETIEVKLDLDNVTLEDVMEALYEKYDMTECVICWREEDGSVRMAGDGTNTEAEVLLEDILGTV